MLVKRTPSLFPELLETNLYVLSKYIQAIDPSSSSASNCSSIFEFVESNKLHKKKILRIQKWRRLESLIGHEKSDWVSPKGLLRIHSQGCFQHSFKYVFAISGLAALHQGQHFSYIMPWHIFSLKTWRSKQFHQSTTNNAYLCCTSSIIYSFSDQSHPC